VGLAGEKNKLTACKPGILMLNYIVYYPESHAPRSVAKTLQCDSLPPTLINTFGPQDVTARCERQYLERNVITLYAQEDSCQPVGEIIFSPESVDGRTPVSELCRQRMDGP
jgi:hypothetical protein